MVGTTLRIHWGFPTILKTGNKSICSNVFWYVKVYIFWKFIQYTIHWDKTQMLKRIPSEKMHSFFCELQLIKIFLLIRNVSTSWWTWFISLKLCVGFSIFNTVSLLLNFIFLFNKKHELFDFKTPWFLSKIKLIEKPHTVLLSNLWILSCNKNFENSVYLRELEFPQKIPGDELFKILKFWVRHFCSITIK